jgi:hypothetical protein
VQGSAITSRASQGAYETGRPLEAVGNGAELKRMDLVLALVVADLARAWAKQRRKRKAITTPVDAVPQTTSEERTWKP